MEKADVIDESTKSIASVNETDLISLTYFEFEYSNTAGEVE